jgi:hypothetical protein
MQWPVSGISAGEVIDDFVIGLSSGQKVSTAAVAMGGTASGLLQLKFELQ